MEEFIGEIILILAGLILEIWAGFQPTSRQKRIVQLLGVILIAAALIWIGIQIGQRDSIPEETPSPTPTALPPSPTPDTLEIFSTATGLDQWLIQGSAVNEIAVNDEVVVYGFRQDQEIAVGLLRIVVTNRDANNVIAQALLVHPTIPLEPNLRVDDNLNNLSTSELFPAYEPAIGYLREPDRLRLEPEANVQSGDILQFLEPDVIGGAITDYLPGALVQVTTVGVEGATATAQLVDGAEWPSNGTLLRRPDSVIELPQSQCGGQTFIPADYDASLFDQEFGVTRYNAFNDIRGNRGQRNNSVRSLFVGDDGIWVGFVEFEGRGGVSFFQPDLKSWEPCAATIALVNDIYQDESGAVWVATDGDWAWQLRAGTWTRYAVSDGFPTQATYAILPQNGQILIGTYEGVAAYNGASWTVPFNRNNNSINANPVHNLVQDNVGGIWVGHINEGLSYVTEDGFVAYTQENSSLPSNQVRGLVLDQRERLWIATTDAGVAIFDGSQWQQFTVENSQLPSNRVTTLAVDKFDRIWAGTDSGASYYDGANWQPFVPFPTADIVIGDANCADCPFNDDHIWIGTIGSGIVHSRLPAETAVVTEYVVENVPESISPGGTFSPKVTVHLEAGIQLQEGDMLAWQRGEDASHPIAPYLSAVTVTDGISVVFDLGAYAEPITIEAPQEPGIYRSVWRLWQNGRYVGPSIPIEFEVVNP